MIAKRALLALPLLAGLTLAAPAHAQWRHHGYGWGPGPVVGAVVGGTLLGLGIGSLFAPPPPVVYAPPPPAYYPAPAYAYRPYYAPRYYAPAPGYYYGP